MIDFVQKCALPTFIPAKVHLLEKINRPLSSSIICQYQALWTAQELSPLFAFLRNFMTEHNLNPCDKGSGGCQSSQVGVGKNIDSSMHCNIFFPSSISTHKILWINSGKQRPLTTRCPSLGASRSLPPAARTTSPVTWLEGRRVMHRRNTVAAVEAGSRCLTHRSFRDYKLPVQPVSPWLLHRAPAGSTLLRVERGVQCQHVTPSRRARGTAVFVYFRQKSTMQSQKQWHFLSLTMVALFYI